MVPNVKIQTSLYSGGVDRRVKYDIYISGHLNMLLWRSKMWNLTDTNLKKLNLFHHSAIDGS